MPLKWPLRRRNGGDKDRQKNDDDDSLQNNDQQLPQTLPANDSTTTTTTMVERFSDYSESDSDGGDNHQSSEIESTLVPGLLTSKSYSAPSTSSRRRQSEGSVSEPARARTSERPLSALDEMFSATTTTMTTTVPADGMQASADRLRPSLDELFCTTVEGQARLQASLRYGNTQQERPVSTAEHIRRQMRRNATHMVEMTSRPVVKLHKKVTRNRIRSTPSETPVYPRANGLPEMQTNGFSDMTFAAQAEVASGHLTSNGGGGNDNIVIMDLDDVDGC